LDVGMPQMLLDGPEIATRSAQKLDAARVTEGMWMKLGQSCLLAQRLDQLEYSMVSHALLTPSSALDLEPHHEEGRAGERIWSFSNQVFGQDSPAYLRKWHGGFMTALATHPPQTELRQIVPNIQTDDF
jgi:hypothetical protein